MKNPNYYSYLEKIHYRIKLNQLMMGIFQALMLLKFNVELLYPNSIKLKKKETRVKKTTNLKKRLSKKKLLKLQNRKKKEKLPIK